MKNLIKKSQYLSKLLRHEPEELDLSMDEQGWVSVKELIASGEFDRKTLDTIVESDKKGRYSYSQNKSLIRANQGHSLDFVHIKFEKVKLTEDLYHGTSWKNVNSILENGLKPMSRKFVHLSKDKKTAYTVGKRYSRDSEPCILRISKDIDLDVFISDNGVFLVDKVEPKFISIDSK